MVSFLDGPLANAIHKGFAGKLLQGTLTRSSAGTSTDENGDPVGSSVSTYTFEGLVDTFSDQFRAQAGIPDGDVKILIIANSISVQPDKDDKVEIARSSGSQKFQIRKLLDVDPARATYTCQGFPLK